MYSETACLAFTRYARLVSSLRTTNQKYPSMFDVKECIFCDWSHWRYTLHKNLISKIEFSLSKVDKLYCMMSNTRLHHTCKSDLWIWDLTTSHDKRYKSFLWQYLKCFRLMWGSFLIKRWRKLIIFRRTLMYS